MTQKDSFQFVQGLVACNADSYQNIHCLLLIRCTLPVPSAEVKDFLPPMQEKD